jgi:hypothetical protein
MLGKLHAKGEMDINVRQNKRSYEVLYVVKYRNGVTFISNKSSY